MKFFIDTAKVEDIREANDMGVICGVTTNPSLIAKEGRDFNEVIKEITTIVDGPISGEVKATTTDAEGMIREGREIAAIHPNMVVKIPMTVEGLKAVKVLSAEGIDVPVVDPTGAGDTFAAALACCIEENVRMEDAISFCNCAGTLVCTKRGAIGMAIPTREQVLDMMRLHPARLHMESLQALYEKEHKHEIA